MTLTKDLRGLSLNDLKTPFKANVLDLTDYEVSMIMAELLIISNLDLFSPLAQETIRTALTGHSRSYNFYIEVGKLIRLEEFCLDRFNFQYLFREENYFTRWIYTQYSSLDWTSILYNVDTKLNDLIPRVDRILQLHPIEIEYTDLSTCITYTRGMDRTSDDDTSSAEHINPGPTW